MSKIALDFGTSNTVLARFDDATGQVRSIELSGVTTPVTCRLEAGGRTETVHVVPSMLHYTEKEILIGRQVADRGLPRDPQTFQWIKRRLAMGARKRRKTVRGHVDPLTAGTDFLNTLISYAANEVSLADDEFTFTAPVEAFEDFEDWLRRVAEDLGIRRLRIVDEATIRFRQWVKSLFQA